MTMTMMMVMMVMMMGGSVFFAAMEMGLWRLDVCTFTMDRFFHGQGNPPSLVHIGGVFLCFARVKKDGPILEQITGASLVYLTIYISYYCNCHLPIDPFLVVFHGARYYRQKVRSLEGLPLPGRGLARVIYPDEQRARDILKESWNAEFFVVENCWLFCGEFIWGKNYGDE